MPTVPVHASNSCLGTYVARRRDEINNMPVSTERSMFPILLVALKAKIKGHMHVHFQLKRGSQGNHTCRRNSNISSRIRNYIAIIFERIETGGKYMTNRTVVFLSLLGTALLLFCVSSCGNDSSRPLNKVPPFIEEDAKRLIADLTAQGFEVKRGYFKLYTQDDCSDSYKTMKSCYGNNPAAPYIMFAVPSWPEEYVDPATKLAFGRIANGYKGSFRLDPREAIVIIGLMPPPSAYFGLQTYLFTREGTFDKTSPTYQYIATNFPALLSTFFTQVPRNMNRIELFASLSNSNNDIVVQQQSGVAFDQKRYFIITPDQFMDTAVRMSLNRIAVESSSIFTESIPSVPDNLSTVKTGLDEHADELAWVMRYAMPFDGGGSTTPSDNWRKDLPLVVLRVRDTKQGRAAQPYGPFVLETRTAINESWLQYDLANLVSTVNRKWGQPCSNADCSDQGTTSFIDLQSYPINLVGPTCMGIGMNCLADTQDTTYQGTPNLSLDNGEIYAVVGTLGTETGNATYVGLSVNESLMVKGLANINSDQLKNTAIRYSGQVNNADKFYVYYFTRDCSDLKALTDGNCFAISDTMIQPCSDPTTQTCDYLKLIQREYIAKGTRRGPDSTLTLLPKLIKLKRR